MLNQAKEVSDQEERKRCTKAEQLIVDDAPWVFLGYQKHQVVTRANITDFCSSRPTSTTCPVSARRRQALTQPLSQRALEELSAPTTMTRYVTRRLLLAVPVLLGIMTAVFVMIQLIPG